MKKVLAGGVAMFVAAMLFFVFWLSVRGELVKLKVGYVGKTKMASGYQEGIHRPGYFRLPSTWWGLVPVQFVQAEVCDHHVTEHIEALYMPKDKLNLKFDIEITISVKDDEQSLDAIYSRLTADRQDGSVSTITFQQVYNTYGQSVIRTVSQQVLATHTIEEVFADLAGTSQDIQKAINEHLKNSPLEVRMVGIGMISPPDVIITAVEKAKQREIDNEVAKSTKIINITNAEANYQIGLIEQQIQLVEAETQVLCDVVLNSTVSRPYIAQRSLRVLSNMAKNPNVHWLLSTEVFEDPALLLGVDPLGTTEVEPMDPAKQELLDRALQLIEQAKQDAIAEIQAEKEQGVLPNTSLEQPSEPSSEDSNVESQNNQ
ncbi:MAG: hypothetical protein KDD62_11445 [Bdellovibrionales bacterium]|nr:hypothetical protein [Bdellovibrionales bacterium]